MTQTKDLVVRLQPLDGAWEVLGSDRSRGVWAENDVWSADEWGSSKASFDLHRDPGTPFPDLQAFTPIEAEIGGMLVWKGRIAETPLSEVERRVNVQCEGMQFHLDDDCYQRAYVHTRLEDYKDLRALPGEDLTRAKASGQVGVGAGEITIGWSNGGVVATNDVVGVAMDFGTSAENVRRVVFEWDRNLTDSSIRLYAWAFPSPPSQASGGTAASGFPITPSSATPGTVAGTFSTPARYLAFFVIYTGGGGTFGQDNIVRIKSVQAFTDTAYESGNVSILKSPMVVRDALTRGTVLLSSDRTQIDPTGAATFGIPDFALQGDKTPREVWMAADAMQDWRRQIDVRGRPVYTPKPSAALIEIGAWPGSSFEDASAGAGEDIYNRVIVEGQGGDGTPIRVERSQSQQPTAVLEPITSPAAGNPSFATNTATWTPSSPSTITRDTGVFDTTPACGRWDRSGAVLANGDTLTETFTGTFVAGRSYTLELVIQTTVALGNVTVRFGTAEEELLATGGFDPVTITYTPLVDNAAVTLTLTIDTFFVPAGFKVYVDSLVLNVAKPTLVDRRGFRRTHILPIRSALTTELAELIGDTWLAAHRTTPLKGTVNITGDRACREILTGAGVPPELLLTRTTELLRLSHRVDPDTGGHGRDGRIAEVTYTRSADEAVVALDSRRTSHEALLERLAVVTGSV